MRTPEQVDNGPPSYTGTTALAVAAGVSTDTVRRDAREGRIAAERPGGEFLFTPQQLAAALRYYRQRRGASDATENAGDG